MSPLPPLPGSVPNNAARLDLPPLPSPPARSKLCRAADINAILPLAQPHEILVDHSSLFAFRDLKTAVQRAKNHDRIVIMPGTYHGGMAITASIEIVAKFPGTVTVKCDGPGPVFNIKSEACILRHLNLVSQAGSKTCTLVHTSGRLGLEHCRVEGAQFHVLARAEVQLDNCTVISHENLSAFFGEKGSKCEIFNSRVESDGNGISICGSIFMQDSCVVNVPIGIAFFSQDGDITLLHTKIENVCYGLRIINCKQCTLEYLTLENCSDSGVNLLNVSASDKVWTDWPIDPSKTISVSITSCDFSKVNNGQPVIRSMGVEAIIKASQFNQTRSSAISAVSAKVIQERNQFKPRDASVTTESVLKEMDALVGLRTVKEDFRKMVLGAQTRQKLLLAGRVLKPASYHTVLTGGPGTGKTTVARLLGKAYCAVGLLDKGHVVEVGRSELVASYIGQTAPKTLAKLEEARGGILFIDEAYDLYRPQSSSDFGSESINQIMTFMENHRDEIIIVVAGYRDRMVTFLDSNPGIQSRFNKNLHFDDYSPPELALICSRFLEGDGFQMNEEFKLRMLLVCHLMYDKRSEQFGNARAMRNFYEECQASYLERISVLSSIDVPFDLPDVTSPYKSAIEQAISSSPKFAIFCDKCGAESDWTPALLSNNSACEKCATPFANSWGIWRASSYYANLTQTDKSAAS